MQLHLATSLPTELLCQLKRPGGVASETITRQGVLMARMSFSERYRMRECDVTQCTSLHEGFIPLARKVHKPSIRTVAIHFNVSAGEVCGYFVIHIYICIGGMCEVHGHYGLSIRHTKRET